MELWHCPFRGSGGETVGKGEGFKEGWERGTFSKRDIRPGPDRFAIRSESVTLMS